MKTTRLIALAGLVLLTAMQAQGYAQQAQQGYGYVLPQQAYVVPTGYLVQQPDGGNMVLFAGGQYEDFQDGTACEPDCCEPPCCEPPCCQPTCCEPTCCGTCDGYCCGESCGCPKWQFFGEFLYMRPRNSEVDFGALHDAQTSTIDFDYKPAFRAGCSRAVSDCSSVGISYTYLYTDTSDAISIQDITIDATHSIDVDLVDIDYRRVFSCSELHTLTYLVGARYGSLGQKFSSQSAIPGGHTFLTDIDFEGGGIRVGLEGERYASNCGLMVYGRGAASFVAGEFRAHYERGIFPDMESVDWKAGRIVTMLDLEVGVGWTSSNGLLRVTGGYMVSGWFNTVKTDKFIEAVESNNFVGLGDTLTFDGLTARAELRF